MAGEPRWLYILRVSRILLQSARRMVLQGGVNLSPGKGLNWQLDVGYVIECLANPERKKQRTFCWPDEERQGNYEPL